MAKPRVAAQFIIARHPAMRHLITPRVEHLQTLLLTRLVANLWRDVACLASWLVACPVLGQGQPEVEQGMIVRRDVAHEDADLAIVDPSPGGHTTAV